MHQSRARTHMGVGVWVCARMRVHVYTCVYKSRQALVCASMHLVLCAGARCCGRARVLCALVFVCEIRTRTLTNYAHAGTHTHTHALSYFEASARTRTRTHARVRTRARAHTHTHSLAHARARAHTHTHTSLQGVSIGQPDVAAVPGYEPCWLRVI